MKKILFFILFFSVLFLTLKSVDAQCSINIQAKDISSFMDEIPSINTQLNNCPKKSPIFLYKNGNFLVKVEDVTTNTFTLVLKNGNINGIKTNPTIPSYTVTISEKN